MADPCGVESQKRDTAQRDAGAHKDACCGDRLRVGEK